MGDLIELDVEARGRLATSAIPWDAERVITVEEVGANLAAMLHEWMGTEKDEER